MNKNILLTSFSVSVFMLAVISGCSDMSQTTRNESDAEISRAEKSLVQPQDVFVAQPATEMAESVALKRAMVSPGQGATLYSSMVIQTQPAIRENYQHTDPNPVKRVSQSPLSTFSIDVDTGSYSNVRRFLQSGSLPPLDAVRVEELLNYFSYDYPAPDSSKSPFSTNVELATTPWNPNTRLLHIGIKGYQEPSLSERAVNLVFLVDVSGSMNQPNKIGLLKSSLKMMTRQLKDQDTISLVSYAGATRVVLEPTPVSERKSILSALEQLTAGGSTNGEAGINLAYQQAESAFTENGINRVILATDGDFNVGISDVEKLKALIARKRDSGIALTTLGFGTGNYNDFLMEQLADTGNGNYAYIDTLSEARKVLVDELSSTLLTIAKDVKIQIEFNPATVSEYRLIGYSNRLLKDEDFNNDRIDAGEIGAGHTVTALYEIALTGEGGNRIDPLRYQTGDVSVNKGDISDEIALIKLRYKLPDENKSRLITQVVDSNVLHDDASTSDNFRFSAAVAAFGQSLVGSGYLEEFTLSEISSLARSAKGDDPFGYRSEFLKLVSLAEALRP